MGILRATWDHYVAFRERHPRLISWLARYSIFFLVLFFAMLYCAISLLKHMNFESHGYDLGIFDQHIWQLSRLEFGYNTVRQVPSLLGDHFHPILFLVVPAYWIWSDARMLLIYQAVLVALGAFPVYYAARHALKSSFCALCLAAAYLFFWGTMELVFFDFHELAFAGPIVGLSYLFIQREKWPCFLATIPFLLMVKETMALLAFFLGLYVLVFHRRWFAGASTCLIAAGWFYLITQKAMPAIAGGTDFFYFQYYSHLGKNWMEAGKYLLTHPWEIVKQTFSPHHKTGLLLFLLAPFLFLPLLGGFAIVALPPLYEHLLSNHFRHWEIRYHYHAVFAPIFIFALLEALPRLHRWLMRRGRLVDYRKLVFWICLTVLAIQVPFTFSRSAITLFDPGFYRIDPKVERTGYDIISMIPPEASVCAQDSVVPHLTHRRHIYQFDGNPYGAEYVILNKFLDCFPLNQRTLVWEIARMYRNPLYEAHRFGYGWVVFTIKPEYDLDGKLEDFPI